MKRRAFSILFCLLTLGAGAQSNALVSPVRSSGPKPADSAATAVRAERVRAECVQGRRCICGRILKVLPDGLVVESGYTSLLRPALYRSWLVPGTVPANRDPHLVEAKDPDSVCTGLVFLADSPKTRGVKAKPYDYVVLHAYPAGQYTYTSAGSIQRTVRRFACGLETAVRLTLDGGEKSSPEPAAVVTSVSR
jgi:hypothetical protein